MRKTFNYVRAGAGQTVGAVVVTTAMMVNQANAAVDAAVGTALTALQADAASLLALVFPVILAIFAMLAGIKLFKRFGSKI